LEHSSRFAQAEHTQVKHQKYLSEINSKLTAMNKPGDPPAWSPAGFDNETGSAGYQSG